MPNRLTRGKALVGQQVYSDGGMGLRVKRGTIARTDTSAKDLFQLPAGAVIDDLVIFGPAASNAGTTATISVGKTGTNNHFVNAFDVKGTTGAGNQHPAATNLGSVGASAITVVGIYAESGAASTAGGPWTVTMIYHLP